MTVRQMEAAMTKAELDDWREYHSQEPFGTPIDDLRIGIMSASVVSALTGEAQRVGDHMPNPGGQGRGPRKMSAKEIEAVMDAMVMATN